MSEWTVETAKLASMHDPDPDRQKAALDFLINKVDPDDTPFFREFMRRKDAGEPFTPETLRDAVETVRPSDPPMLGPVKRSASQEWATD